MQMIKLNKRWKGGGGKRRGKCPNLAWSKLFLAVGNNSQLYVTFFSLIQKGTFAALLPFPSRWILDTPLPTIIKCPSGKSKDGVQNTVYLSDELRLTRTERHYVESTTHNDYTPVNCKSFRCAILLWVKLASI